MTTESTTDDAVARDGAVPPTGVRAGDLVDERYRIDRLIAEGGMATVYLAQDLKHGRAVAMKVLHQTLSHTIGVQRFLREIEVIAQLQHPHLLTLIDSGLVGELPYYVMPYIEALSLREFIQAHTRLSIADAVRITREVADGLAYAHARGVVHRDIKPSNILMSDGHAVVADFGIATAIRRSSVGRITVTGSSIGSPTYMSPEQAAGEHDVDARSDVYSLACVLFEMLAGVAPIDNVSMQEMVTRKLTGRHAKLRTLRPEVPMALEVTIERALSPDRDGRFESASAFAAAVQASLPRPAAMSRGMRWAMAFGALVVIGGGSAMYLQQRRVTWATQQIGEIRRLAERQQYHAAFDLAEQVQPVIPRDSTLRELRPFFTQFARIVTVPAGATVSVQRVGSTDSAWRRVGITPIESLPLPRFLHEPGYRVRIERPGYESVRVLAGLFTDMSHFGGSRPLDTLYLDPLGRPTAGMARIRGLARPPEQGGRLRDYHVARFEVTNREYARFVAAGGYARRDLWVEPMQRGGRAVPWEEGVAGFRDESGRPGPSTWRNGTYPAGEDSFPVGGVSYYEAAAYARFAGKRLPTSSHWAAAALRSWRELSFQYAPTSALGAKGPRPVGRGDINVYGLYDVVGNVREWTVNPMLDGRVTRGASWDESIWHVGALIPRDPFDRSAGNGLRLAMYADEDSVETRLSARILREEVRDYRGFHAASDEVFSSYRALFDYDRTPLASQVVDSGSHEDFRWKKVTFASAYPGPRAGAYVFLPRDSTPPYDPVLFWPPGDAQRRIDPRDPTFRMLVSFVMRSGRALVLPMFAGSPDRPDSTFSKTRALPETTAAYRELVVAWIRDVRRTIDYVETQRDLRAEALTLYGVSWGGAMAPILLAVEPRIKAAALFGAGYFTDRRARPEVDPAHYAPRVRQPVLMHGGLYDTVFPYETSQRPFLEQLGTPDRDKALVQSQKGHVSSSDAIATRMLAFFDQYRSTGAPLREHR